MQEEEKKIEGTPSFYSKKARGKLQSPDDLEKYLRMPTPGIWISIIACIAIFLGIGAWAFFGSVADRITLKGAAGMDGIVCFVDSDTALRIKEGDFAYVDGVAETVTHVEETAVDVNRYKEEGITDLDIRQLAGDTQMVHVIVISDSQKLELKKSVPVTITVDQKTPISMIFGK